MVNGAQRREPQPGVRRGVHVRGELAGPQVFASGARGTTTRSRPGLGSIWPVPGGTSERCLGLECGVFRMHPYFYLRVRSYTGKDTLAHPTNDTSAVPHILIDAELDVVATEK